MYESLNGEWMRKKAQEGKYLEIARAIYHTAPSNFARGETVSDDAGRYVLAHLGSNYALDEFDGDGDGERLVVFHLEEVEDAD